MNGYSIMESYIYTTRKLNFTLLYRVGIENENRAKEVLHYVKYFVENLKNLEDSDITVEEALRTISYKK